MATDDRAMLGGVKSALVRALNGACTVVDDVAYRPAVVKLTLRLPCWWSCQLARLSMALDRRWQTGYWDSGDAPAAPGGICDACKRRAAWLDVGGWAECDDDDELDERDEIKARNDYLAFHVVHLCGWCRLGDGRSPKNAEELQQMLDGARSRSVSWRWR